jgi:hypothetical protein
MDMKKTCPKQKCQGRAKPDSSFCSGDDATLSPSFAFVGNVSIALIKFFVALSAQAASIEFFDQTLSFGVTALVCRKVAWGLVGPIIFQDVTATQIGLLLGAERSHGTCLFRYFFRYLFGFHGYFF